MSGSFGRGLILFAALPACSSDEPRPPPPPVVGTGIDNPLGCRELRSGVMLRNDQLLVDGGTAVCAVSGLICALDQTSELSRLCPSGARADATCVGNEWTLRCSGDGG